MSKMAGADEIRNHYATNFRPKDYQERVINRKGKFKHEEQFFINSLTNFFQNPKVKGYSLLDIGSGPTVHNISPACNNFSSIVLSDFVEDNRNELKKWLNGEEDALNWSHFLEAFSAALGYKDVNVGCAEIEALIRQKVKAVIHCDVLADKIVPDEFAVTYDAILTCLTLEAACENLSQFKVCLKKINTLLKSKGYLIMTGFLKAEKWTAGEHSFPYLSLSQDDIHKSLHEAGFNNIEWKLLPKSDDYSFNFESCYCLCCVKDSESDFM